VVEKKTWRSTGIRGYCRHSIMASSPIAGVRAGLMPIEVV